MTKKDWNVNPKKDKGERKMATTQQVLGEIMRSKECKVKMRQNILAHQRNMAWLTSRYDELRKDYKDKFVAVHDERIVVASGSFAQLRAELEKYPYADVAAISYISPKRPMLIL